MLPVYHRYWMENQGAISFLVFRKLNHKRRMIVQGTAIIVAIGNERSGMGKKGPWELGEVVVESVQAIEGYRRRYSLSAFNEDWTHIKNNFQIGETVSWTGMLEAKEGKDKRHFLGIRLMRLEYPEVRVQRPASGTGQMTIPDNYESLPADDDLPF